MLWMAPSKVGSSQLEVVCIAFNCLKCLMLSENEGTRIAKDYETSAFRQYLYQRGWDTVRWMQWWFEGSSPEQEICSLPLCLFCLPSSFSPWFVGFGAGLVSSLRAQQSRAVAMTQESSTLRSQDRRPGNSGCSLYFFCYSILWCSDWFIGGWSLAGSQGIRRGVREYFYLCVSLPCSINSQWSLAALCCTAGLHVGHWQEDMAHWQDIWGRAWAYIYIYTYIHTYIYIYIYIYAKLHDAEQQDGMWCKGGISRTSGSGVIASSIVSMIKHHCLPTSQMLAKHPACPQHMLHSVFCQSWPFLVFGHIAVNQPTRNSRIPKPNLFSYCPLLHWDCCSLACQ